MQNYFRTPNLERLKDAACSDELLKAFKLFFKQQMLELQGFIKKLEEDCEQLRMQTQKQEEYLGELEISCEDATLIIKIINDTLKKERSRFGDLEKLLVKARNDMLDKKREVAYVKQKMKDQD
jgi:uncharacterized protein YwgA